MDMGSQSLKMAGVGRKDKRSFAQKLGCFLSKTGLVKQINKLDLIQKRKKKASGTAFLLQVLFSKLFLVSSIYAMKSSPVPKNILKKFDVEKFLPKTSFYREICNLKLKPLEKLNDFLLKKTVDLKKKIIIVLDTHAIEVWSKNYADAAWGASSCGTFFGYKLFAAILYGTDIVIQYLLVPANFVELNFAEQQIIEILKKLPRIDVLLIDRGYFSFTFFAFLMQKNIGFIIPAKNDTAAIQPYLRNIASKPFHDLNEYCCYHEALIKFSDLKKNLRVIFVKRFVKEKMKEFELISNLPYTYSAEDIIKLYSKRQGREDVFDRLKNELRLHKPSKITDFNGIKAFIALTITAYNIYALFSHTLTKKYIALQSMHRLFLFNTLENFIEKNKEKEKIADEIVTETQRYKADCKNSLFNMQTG